MVPPSRDPKPDLSPLFLPPTGTFPVPCGYYSTNHCEGEGMHKALLSVLLMIAISGPCLAQSESATLSGRVVDPSGAAIVGAEVVLTNVDTNVEQRTKTNAAGLYVFTGLHPGRYRAAAGATGFKTLIKENLVLHVQDEVAENFSLPLGSVTESITVTAGGGLIDTESAAVSTVVDRQFAESLPLNGRSFNTLLQLTPGVVIAPDPRNSGGTQFSINGQRTNANYFSVDGVSADFGVSTSGVLVESGSGSTQAFNVYGGTSSLVSVDAMQEFRVQTSTFAPEYGRTPGGQVSIITRSGTNAFHGGIFDYFRNDKLDANDWFANAAGQPRAAERQNDFGGFFGGPIFRNRTFFFFSYEGLRLRLPTTRSIPVPSLAIRTATVASAAPYLNAYPLPNGPVSADGTTAQFTGNYSDPTTLNASSVRIDHTFNERLAIFGRYNHAPSHTQNRGIGGRFPDSSGQIVREVVNTQTLTLGATAQFTPTIINSFRGNYSIQETDRASRPDSFGGAMPPDPRILLPSPFSETEGFAVFLPFQAVQYRLGRFGGNRNSQVNLLDDLAVSVGVHQLKFGVDYRGLHLDAGGFNPGLFYEVFSLTNFASTGTADIVFNQVNRPSKVLFRSFSLYVQDAWKIGSRLTLTYGLRWEANPAPSGRDGTILASWINVNDPPNLALAPPGTPIWKSTYDNFAPRVGVAYQLTSRGDLVLRGGWGLFYDLGTSAVPLLTTLFPNSANQLAFGQDLPLADVAAVTPSFSLTPPFPPVTGGFSPDLKLPRSYQWNGALEKSLWGQQAFSVTYVAQLGRRLLRGENLASPNSNFPFLFTLHRNGDTSDYHALQLQFRRPLSRGLQALLNYTWSHSIDTSSDGFDLPPGAAISIQNNRGSSSFDARHNFSGAVTYKVPKFVKQGFLAKLTNDWSLDTVMQVRTAFPIDVLTFDVVIPGVAGTPTRPDVVLGQSIWLPDGSAPGGRRLNPDAFSVPSQPRQGTLGRNSIRGFGLTQVDLSIARRFSLPERLTLQFRADFFNLFNHPNFADPQPLILGGVLTFDRSSQLLSRGLGGLSPLYQIGGARSLQLSLRLTF